MSVVKDYFKWQASVLEAAYEGSIVAEHNGDTGTNREAIVRNWLAQHLPKSVTPELGGKIIDESGYIGKQVDIVVYNNALPRFGANEKSHYFAEGVVAAIQVKSKLTSHELTDSVKNLDSVKKCKLQKARRIGTGNSKNSIPTGIFAFETNYSSTKHIIKALDNRGAKGYSLIDFIYVNKKCFIVYNKGNWRITEDDGTRKIPPSGYLIANEDEDCLWRLMLELSSKAAFDVQFLYDFQGYFTEKEKS